MINKKIEAKKRLFETMGKLNKIYLSEKFNIDDNMYATLITAIESLKNGNLLSKRGGKSTVNSQKREDGYYVEIEGIDREKNEYGFNFIVYIEEGLDDDVIQILDVDIIEFFFKASEGEEELRLSEKDLDSFNKQKNIDYYNIITQYIDLDYDTEMSKEEK